MELDCFLCNEPARERIPNDFSLSLRKQHAELLIRLFSFVHQYTAAADGGAAGLTLPLRPLEHRLEAVNYCKKCTISLRGLVQKFKTYDNHGKKLECSKTDFIERLKGARDFCNSSAVGGTNWRLREEIFDAVGIHEEQTAGGPGPPTPKEEGALRAPVVKLRRLEQIPELALYIRQNLGIQHQGEAIVIKQEPLEEADIHGDITRSPEPDPPSPAPYEDQEPDSDSEYEPEEEKEPPKPKKMKRCSTAAATPRKKKKSGSGSGLPRKRKRPPPLPKSVRRLSHLRQHACDYSECFHVLETFAQLEEHATSAHSSEPRPWPCREKHAPSIPCTAAFFKETSLLQHVHYVHNSTGVKYPCSKCLQGFNEYKPYELHQKLDHHGGVGVHGKPLNYFWKRRVAISDRSRGRTLKPYFPCDYVDEGCEFRGRDEWETQDHLAREHPTALRPHVCTETEGGCGARFVTEHRLARHKHWAHSGARYPCQDCDHVCDNYKHLQRHRMRAHGDGERCPHPGCDYMAAEMDHIRAHLKSSVHAADPNDPEVRKHMCQHCGRRFMSNQALVYHIHSRHPDLVEDPEELAKYKCPHCGKIIGSPPTLREHIKIVHEREFRFHCEKCGAGYRYANRLRAHMRGHQEPHEFEFECTVCETKFRHKKILREHMRRHTGEFKKEHACRHCGKNFTNSHAARRHERIHAGVLDHVCPVCNKGFPVRNYLVIHMRSHETAEQKEARRKGKEEERAKLPQACRVYFETTKKGAEVKVPYPMHYVKRGPRQDLSRVLEPEELPLTARRGPEEN